MNSDIPSLSSIVNVSAAQSLVVQRNLRSLLSGKPLTAKYDGYASCPLVTGNSKCILAEFDYDLVPAETFPVNQVNSFLLSSILYWKQKSSTRIATGSI